MSSVLVAIAILCQVPNGSPYRGYYEVRRYQGDCQKRLIECITKKGGHLDFALFQCTKEGVHYNDL